MVSWVVIQLCSVSASLPVTFTLGQADDWELWTVNTTHCCQCNLLLDRLMMWVVTELCTVYHTTHTLAKVKPAPFKEVQSCSYPPPYLAQLNIFILTMLCQMAYNTHWVLLNTRTSYNSRYSDGIQYSMLRCHIILNTQMSYNTQYSDVIQYSILRYHTKLSVANLITVS